MTDPTFDTLEALEAWVENLTMTRIMNGMQPKSRAAIFTHDQIARVLAAHSHLLEGNDDAK